MKSRSLSWLALLTSVMLIISACGGQQAATPTAAPAGEVAAPTAAPAAEAPAVTPTAVVEFGGDAAPGQKTIVWMVRTGPDENRWERDVVLPAWNKANPDKFIKVLNIVQDDIAVKREAMIAAKEPLHVWTPNWGGDGFASDRYRGLLADLTPLIERDKFDTSDYIPEVLAIYNIDGKQWGLPFLTTGNLHLL